MSNVAKFRDLFQGAKGDSKLRVFRMCANFLLWLCPVHVISTEQYCLTQGLRKQLFITGGGIVLKLIENNRSN